QYQTLRIRRSVSNLAKKTDWRPRAVHLGHAPEFTRKPRFAQRPVSVRFSPKPSASAARQKRFTCACASRLAAQTAFSLSVLQDWRRSERQIYLLALIINRMGALAPGRTGLDRRTFWVETDARSRYTSVNGPALALAFRHSGDFGVEPACNGAVDR